jgi:glycosyltransferase involved in cell wall biosynthesis
VKILVWQWYRRGGPPRFAALLTEALRKLPDMMVILSLSNDPNAAQAALPISADLPVTTYHNLTSLIRSLLKSRSTIDYLLERVRAFQPDLAICAQPHMLDMMMAFVLQRLGVPFVVLVHDADTHPGDGLPLQMWLQRKLCARAVAVGALSEHVGKRLLEQRVVGEARPLLKLHHPPVVYAMPNQSSADNNQLRLLVFGRLLPYKGLDLLVEALIAIGPSDHMVVRVVGSGPETPILDRLRAMDGVTVENRWVADEEIGSVLAWSNALVLPYREASQSGVAAAALAAGRHVLATRVGGLAEQLAGDSRAILCEPTAASLSDGLRLLMERIKDQPLTPKDAAGEWQAMAAALLRGLPLTRNYRA